MSPDAVAAATEVLSSGSLTQGPEVDKFEEALAAFLRYSCLATVNSGTSAISLALRLAGMGPGDEVVSTPLTCFATNAPILATHAMIRWADVGPGTCNVDGESIERSVTDRTAAIVVVHWGGIPVDVGDIRRRLSQRLGYCPPIIEDCAHAFGAEYEGGGRVERVVCFYQTALRDYVRE
jgi:dTDP-4-amino-4,6-dideoxygalactose transaminase